MIELCSSNGVDQGKEAGVVSLEVLVVVVVKSRSPK
jgi:hypothetical protein